MRLFIVLDFPPKVGCHGCYRSCKCPEQMRCLIRFQRNPSHLQNFRSMPDIGLMLLDYRAQLVNQPRMSRQKSSKFSPVHQSKSSTHSPLNSVHTNERSTYVMLKVFDWMNEPPCFFGARNFALCFFFFAREISFQKQLGLLLYWGRKPSEGDRRSYSWALSQ